MSSKENIIQFLQENKINFKDINIDSEEFPPPDSFWKEKGLIRCKNLFFRDNHGKNHFLAIFNYYNRLDIKRLQEITGRGSLTMASGWRLDKYLGLTPGFLSVFGLMNDKDQHVKVIIDKKLEGEKRLSFLPNTNGGSFFIIDFSDLLRFIQCRGNAVQIAYL